MTVKDIEERRNKAIQKQKEYFELVKRREEWVKTLAIGNKVRIFYYTRECGTHEIIWISPRKSKFKIGEDIYNKQGYFKAQKRDGGGTYRLEPLDRVII